MPRRRHAATLGGVLSLPRIRGVSTFLRCAIVSLCLLTVLFCLLLIPSFTVHAKHHNKTYQETIPLRASVIIKATDAQGRPVTGLSCADFLLRVNKQPVAWASCAPLPTAVAVGFALDTSRSVRDIIFHERETALALVSHFGPETSVGIVSFGIQPKWLLSFTTDVKAARRAFNTLPPESERTALFDGAAALLPAWAASARAEQRIGIIISDGLDNASQISAASLLAEAQALGVTFYVIHFPFYEPRDGHLAARPMVSGVRELAERTGGRYFRVGTAQDALNPRAEYDLRPVFQALAQDVGGRYRLSFALPDNKTATRRRWEIKWATPHAGWRLQILRENQAVPTP